MPLTRVIPIAAFLLLPCAAYAWDGTDTDTGASVEIEEGNLVRSGETIEVYDYDRGEYHNIDVDSVESNGSGATVEGYDTDTGNYVEFDME